MENTIKVRIKAVYGEDKIYPVNYQAKLFALIAGTTTLTPFTIRNIVALGYNIEVEPAKVPTALAA